MNVKFSTKFVAASAAAVMALSLAGCSGGSMDDSSSSSAKASGDSITIGTVTTNSGTAAAYGEAEVKGFELAVSEINAKGGINGKKVKLESMDDKGDATEASNAYNKLAGDNNVLAVAGPTISATTAAVAPLADQSKLVTIAPAATSDSIETGNYLFRTCFKDSYQGEVAARFAAENLKVKKVAVLYGTGESVLLRRGRGLRQGRRKARPRSGGQGKLLLRRRHRVLRPAAEDPGFRRRAALRSVLLLRGWPVHHPAGPLRGFRGLRDGTRRIRWPQAHR